MKTNELRIGNFVATEGIDFVEVSKIDADFGICYKIPQEFGQFYPYKEVEPIPLTEEWLQDFEFHYEGEFSIFGSSYTKGGIELTYAKATDGIVILCKNVIGMNLFIDHVHQLQNLYFALTGEELTIYKEETK